MSAGSRKIGTRGIDGVRISDGDGGSGIVAKINVDGVGPRRVALHVDSGGIGRAVSGSITSEVITVRGR